MDLFKARCGFFLFLAIILISLEKYQFQETKTKPEVLVSFLVRNKAHTLPYFLWSLDKLDFPKRSISLWIRSDHNADNSTEQVKVWLKNVQHLYHSVNFEHDDKVTDFANQTSPLHWSNDRFAHIIKLRQAALDAAREAQAKYFFMIDADVILRNPDTLQRLIKENKPIIAPLINVTVPNAYSNFWGAIGENGFYAKSPYYYDILLRHLRGCILVPVVHSAVLVDLQHPASKLLTFSLLQPSYTGPYNDVVIFAHSAKYANMKMYLLNDDYFGHFPVHLRGLTTLQEDREQFIHMKAELMVDGAPLEKLSYLQDNPLVAKSDKLGFDDVYVINLERRKRRRMVMEKYCEQYNIQCKIRKGSDGRALNSEHLQMLQFQMLPGYLDTDYQRPLTRGEIGCFFSHYSIWVEVVQSKIPKVLIFEDNVRLGQQFRSNMEAYMTELKEAEIDWDLIFLGRKQRDRKTETPVRKTKHFVYPGYSYWAMAYALSFEGAKKLVMQDPLKKLVPVDEFLPIMYNQHPRNDWKAKFHPRNLKTLSVFPLLVGPNGNPNDKDYVSDTEESDILNFDAEGQILEGIWVRPKPTTSAKNIEL